MVELLAQSLREISLMEQNAQFGVPVEEVISAVAPVSKICCRLVLDVQFSPCFPPISRVSISQYREA